MSKRIDGQARGKYTLDFKLEAVRLVKGGQSAAVTAKVLGIPNQTLDNWVRLSNKGQLKGAGDKPVLPEQMELARLRAQLARVTMERDILKSYFEDWQRKDTPKPSKTMLPVNPDRHRPAAVLAYDLLLPVTTTSHYVTPRHKLATRCKTLYWWLHGPEMKKAC